MQSRGRLAKFVAVAFIVLGFLAGIYIYATFELPRKLLVFEGGEYQIKYSMPVTMEAQASENLIVTVEDDNEPRGVKIKIGETDAKGQNLHLDAKLFGLIPLKGVDLNILPRVSLTVCGITAGVKIYASGVMIVGMADINTAEGKINPAYQAGLRVGDIIVRINGTPISTLEELSAKVEGSGGQTLRIEATREGSSFMADVTPILTMPNEKYRLGLWVRDSTAGIGTITYIDREAGVFGGLGHGICDADTGEIIEIGSGTIQSVDITSVKKGEKGEPGELIGDFNTGKYLGDIYKNCDAGIYGRIIGSSAGTLGEPMEAATKEQIALGDAEVWSTIEGSAVKKYKVQIIRINLYSGQDTKNLMIKVTDEELLSKTGGIVQGMSGSPIVQNNRIVGAVTHVLVNDPTRGYGIFIENMLMNSQEISAPDNENAA